MSTTIPEPIPVVICGKTEAVATRVIESLKPEIEVIHLILTPAAGITQIPRLLSGSKDVESASALGTHNYAHPPVAIICGAGYTDDDIEEMRTAVDRASGAAGAQAPWMRPDVVKSGDVHAGMPGYGPMLARRLKETLATMKDEGRLGREGGVIWY